MAQFVATPFPVAPDARETGLWFVVRGVEVLVSEVGEAGLLPPLELVLSLPVAAEPHYLGLLNGVDCFCVEVEKESSVPLGFRYAGLRDLFAALDPVALHVEMVRTLKRTRNLAPLGDLVDRLPESLQAVALSVSVRRADHPRLVEATATPLHAAMAWS